MNSIHDILACRILVTGTTWGLGKAIVDWPKPNAFYEVHGVERDANCQLPGPEYLTRVMERLTARNYDVFINNAYGDDREYTRDSNGQLSVFRAVLDRWRNDPSKTIVNVCSIAAYFAGVPGDTGTDRYRQNKRALLTASEQATLDPSVKCRVFAFSPGYILTKRTDGPKHANRVKMEPLEAAKYIYDLLALPRDIRIPNFPVFRV